MKQQKVTEKKIGESVFFIRPFPAFKSAKISGKLAAVVGPLLGGLAPIIGESAGKGEDFNVEDLDIESALPSAAAALATIDGDVVEDMMMELMIRYRNVSFQNPELTGDDVQVLNEDLANEVFCMDIQDMYRLCWEIVKVNFGGFFKILGIQSGNLQEVVQKKIPKSKSTAPSTQADSQSLN